MWADRQAQAEGELQDLSAQREAADEQAEVLQAQAGEQAESLPAIDEQLRAAQQRANAQRGAVAQVQQQIQVLAAESRSVDEQSRQLKARRDRLAGERQGLATPDGARACTNCPTRCRRWTNSAAPRRTASTANLAGWPTWSRGCRPCAPCRRRCRPRASSSPGWTSTA
jgi:chromosome segregation protein